MIFLWSMWFKYYSPAPKFRRFIKCYAYYKADAGEAIPSIQSLPCGIPCITLNLADGFKVVNHQTAEGEVKRGNLLIGLQTAAYEFMPEKRMEQLSIFFQPSGLYRHFGFSSRALVDDAWKLEDALPAFKKFCFAQELQKCRNNVPAALRCLEQFLAGSMHADGRFAYVEHAVQTIRASRGAISVAALARACNTGQRNLSRRFDEVVGISPKTFARITRFQHALRTVRFAANEAIVWSRIARDLGYFDHTHFIKDFEDICGMSPTRYAVRFAFQCHEFERALLRRCD